ncbi:helix-turn-helix transcriptional regulator [Nocardia sp. CC227C]|uniref:helix-turn-helix domain-containing protein n=1 Tax=Nocardia sp. CC227C TaxID=3044562 RepID=UPI00278C1F95|nr:helix-turn-helix transcriptional regulator [Nocardia sp. CC227C]
MVTGSTLARRALGREMKRLRESIGMSQSAAGRVIGVSQQTIGRMEEGQPTKVSDLYVNTLCDSYRATDDERVILLGLAGEVRTSQKSGGGWWRAYADEMRVGFDHYLSLEAAAGNLVSWKVTIVPGLLQTAEYRRAVAWAETPAASTENIERRVEMMARRQARLDEELTVDIILWEAVLRDPIGGPAVMAGQLRRLVDVGERPNITLRVVPFDGARQRGFGSLVGSFVLLEFPKLPATGLSEPPVVYVEEWAGDLYLEREAEVRRYRDAFTEIGRVALSPDASRQFISAVAKEYTA